MIWWPRAGNNQGQQEVGYEPSGQKMYRGCADFAQVTTTAQCFSGKSNKLEAPLGMERVSRVFPKIEIRIQGMAVWQEARSTLGKRQRIDESRSGFSETTTDRLKEIPENLGQKIY